MSLSLRLPWRQQKPPTNRRLSRSDPQRIEIPLRPLLIFISVGVVVAALAWGWLQLMDPHRVPLRQVQIEGSFERVTAEELRAVVKPYTERGFFGIDMAAVTGAVQALPWVATAEVRRQWPDTLQVTVGEQQALARWQVGGLLNFQGEHFEPAAASYPSDLPLLQGPSSTTATVAQQFKVMQPQLELIGLHLQHLELTPRRAWRLLLSNGVTVVLGRRDAEQRLQRFIRVYPRLVARAEAIKQVDMRYSNGFAVQWQVTPAAAGENYLG